MGHGLGLDADDRALGVGDADQDDAACALAMDAMHSASRGVAFSLKSTVSGSVPVVATSDVIRSSVTSACAQARRECQELT